MNKKVKPLFVIGKYRYDRIQFIRKLLSETNYPKRMVIDVGDDLIKMKGFRDGHYTIVGEVPDNWSYIVIELQTPNRRKEIDR